jgi:nucleotide-binding universal stress UspA family protein
MAPFAPGHILAATDFSEVSTRALRHAVAWARRYGARLSVVHVQEPPPVWGDPSVGSYNLTALVEATWQATLEQLTAYVQQQVPADVSVTHELLSGSPAAAIEEYAEGAGADLVVLGTHGRGVLSRLLLGSVAERAMRMAEQPALIVRSAGEAAAAGAGEPRVTHVLCPVNYTDVARAAFESAAAVARTFEARLTAVFTVEESSLTAQEQQRAEEMLRAWLPAESATGFEIQPLVRHGNAAEQVIALAHEAAVDLVVIGAQHRRFADATVLGVTTVRVTRHAPCPVLVVPQST